MAKKTLKPFKTYSELVEILKQRGMHIEDSTRTERKLAQIGYYRLSGFFYICREFDVDANGDTKSCPIRKSPLRLNSFISGTTFNTVFDLYLFDKQLRKVVMDAIERIEIYLRSTIAHELGQYNPLAYNDSTFINPRETATYTTPNGQQKNVWLDWQTKHLRKINQSNEECILWHRKQQLDIPFWAVIEAWDFGTMSKYFEILGQRYQNRIAKKLDCSNPTEMVSWLKELNTLRNRCSHHSRIWNQKTSNPLKFTSIPTLHSLNLDNNARERLFGQIAILWHFVSIIGPSSKWIDDVAKIINTKPNLPNCNYKSMGFSDEKGFPLYLFKTPQSAT